MPPGRGPVRAIPLPGPAIPKGLVPRRLPWQPIQQAKLKGTIWLQFLDEDEEQVKRADRYSTEFDVDLVVREFCQREEDVKKSKPFTAARAAPRAVEVR